MTQYGAWRAKPVGDVFRRLPTCAATSCRTVVDEALARGGGWLTHGRVAHACSRPPASPTAPTRTCREVDEAVAAADRIGYPVALKAVGPTLLHKTERNAVRLNLTDATAVRAVAQPVRTAVRAAS